MKHTLILILCLLAITGCKTRQIIIEKPVEVVHHDTLRVEHTSRDSIYLHDSVYVDRSKDTILVERWHTAYRDRVQWRDSIVLKTDTIPVTVTQTIVQTERYTPWYMKALAFLGLASLLACAFMVWQFLRK